MTRLACIAAILFATAGTAAAEPRTLTLEEAIKLASEDSVTIDIGKEKVAAAEAKVKSTKTLRLPGVTVKGNVFLWNKELSFDQPIPRFDPEGHFTFMYDIAHATVRELVTGSAEVDVVQPLSALAVIGRLVDADRAGAEAARAELDTARLDAAYQAAETYLAALQTDTLHELAQTSVDQLEADLTKLRALRDAKVLADVDVLRVEAARDAAQQQVLEAEVGGETARAGLALLLDLPETTELQLAPIDTTPPELPWTADDAVALARKQRPELRAADQQQEQADAAIDIAKANYYPSINAIGNYTHSEGQGLFAIKDSAFVGISLEWNIWDWGKRKHDIEQARAGSRIAKRARKATEDQLAFDVRSKWRTASAKKKTLDVSQSALKAAEEAYRLQKVKIEAGVATSTDVIDAESEVSRARAQETIARYQYLISWMALVRAVGQVPDIGAK